MHHVLGSAGPQALHIEVLWWLTLAVCTAVFIVVFTAVLWALIRAPRAGPATPPELARARDRGAQIGLVTALALSAVLLVALSLASFFTDRALAGLGPAQLTVEVTGHQWWWEIRYQDGFTTANELHIPLGKPVLVKLAAPDVIHSFWVPNLSGKKDLIPGREATLTLRADKPGVYRGQCAEFCGLQHAKMAFLVIAEPPPQYEAWAAAEKRPAREPADRRGRDVFMARGCASCHAIQGTAAAGRKAPDLTHLASRRTLASASLPNTVGHLAGWILDPQTIKPGASMPATAMKPEELNALLAFLGALK
jgi:cytochrome c oxidase subunit II